MTDADCFPLSMAEAEQLYHLLFKVTGGLVDLHAPPAHLVGQPIHRKPLVWLWHLCPMLNKAGNQATVTESEFARMPGVLYTAEQVSEFKRRAVEHAERAAAKLLARLEEHEQAYQSRAERAP